MRKLVLLAAVLAIFAGKSVSVAQEAGRAGATELTLAVKEIRVSMSPSFSIESIRMTDEKGNAVAFTGNMDNWFENAKVQNIIMPMGTPISAEKDGAHSYMAIAKDAKLVFTFNVNGNTYPVGVGTGSKFVVQKTSAGKYILRPEETARLSPPPADGNE